MNTISTKPQIVFYIKDVEQTVGKPRVTLRRWWQSGKFPKPKMINSRLSWHVDVIHQWIKSHLEINHG